MGWGKFRDKYITGGLLDIVTGKEEMEKATEAQLQASRDAAAVQERMFEKGREDIAPWREAGVRALGELEKRIVAGPGEYTQSPGYQARLEEGRRNILAGRGNIRSGATEKALVRYGQDYATSDYDNFLNRYYKSLTPFQSIAGVGQTMATEGARMGQQYGQTAGQNILRAGDVRASGYVNQANALRNIIGQGVGLAAMTYGGPGWTWGGQ